MTRSGAERLTFRGGVRGALVLLTKLSLCLQYVSKLRVLYSPTRVYDRATNSNNLEPTYVVCQRGIS